MIPNYKDDEASTASKTVLMMRIGGGKSGGIHGAHFGEGIRIRYRAADAKRQTAWLHRLGKLFDRVKAIEQKLGE